ncbi:MAG TPA: DNA primase [Candidatus Azoamicus sp. OHIO2]
MFNNNNITLLLSNIRLSDVIGLFLNLEKRENRIISLCPFHKEKTPSFLINDKKKFYYCFGCKKFGDAIAFLIDYKKFDFNDAVKFLKNLDNSNNKKITLLPLESNKKKYITLLKNISNFYVNNLIKNLKKNNDLDEFLNKRDISEKEVNEFQIGFALDKWGSILKEFSGNSDKKALMELGLLIKNKNNVYDVFRNRIIFPIRNINGDIVGFGGRILKDNVKPKYINSCESTIFIKKHELYGLYELQTYKEYDSIIIVEGYLDVISLHKNGITNIVSALGTSFSKEQFALLKKKYKKIIFCYDGDVPGQIAAFKIASKLICEITSNLYIGFIILPDNYDPDSIIRSEKKKIFLELLNSPIFILDFIFFYLSKNIDINLVINKIKLFEDITNVLDSIPDKILKSILSKYFYKKILDEDNIDSKKKVSMIENKKVLSLEMKACLFLLRNRELIKLIDETTMFNIQRFKLIDDVHTFLQLINILKANINSTIQNELRDKINCTNGFMEIINHMPHEIIKSEFIEIIKKIEFNEI